MKFYRVLFVLLLKCTVVLHGQTPRLKVTPVKFSVDSLEEKHLYKAYYVTNKSKDTVNISVTVGFDWCVPHHQPKVLLPGQTDSIVFDCVLLKAQPYKNGMFTIDDGRDQYPCELHYSLARKAYLSPPVLDSVPVSKSIAHPNQDSVIVYLFPDTIRELRITRTVDETKRNRITGRRTKRTITQYYSNDSLAMKTEIVYYREHRRKRTGHGNFCVQTRYYSNGKIMHYLEEYNYGYSHTETGPRLNVTVAYKRWDRNGNLICEKK